MTTHFSNGVTNVRGKDGDTSLFSGIKQPLITGGYNQEQAYQNDWITFNDEDWDITTAGGSEFFVPEYAGGWLRIGDNAPAGGEVNGLSSKEVFQYNSGKQWWYETRIAVTDVSDYNIFVGFADNGFVDPATVPTDCIGFSHLEDTTSIQFLSRKNGAGVSFDMTDSSGGSTFTFEDSTVPTQTATTFALPSNSVRLGFHFMPAGTELGQTSNQFKLYLDGKKVGTQAATTVPDDIALELKIFTESKGTNANHLATDWVQTIAQR